MIGAQNPHNIWARAEFLFYRYNKNLKNTAS